MPEKPESPEAPEGPQWGLSPLEEGPKQRPTQAESTPGGVASPLGTETYDTQPLPALDALLQTNFEGLPEIKGMASLIPHAETHMAHGDDEVHSFDTISVYDFILMRKSHETDTGQELQDEISEPSVPTTQVPQGAGYVPRDTPVVQLESEASTDPQRIVTALQPVQDSAGGTGNAFIQLMSDQTLDVQHAEVGLWGFVAAPSGAVGSMGLYTQAASSHNVTPHVHNLTLDPWTHALWLPDTAGGGNQFWIHRVRDPVSPQDAATKNYVDVIVGAVHGPVTLAADAQVLLNLNAQELGLVAQVKNKIFAGPASGGDADPTFRDMVDADIPAAIARDSEVTSAISTHAGVEAAHHKAMKYRFWIPFALDTIPGSSFTP